MQELLCKLHTRKKPTTHTRSICASNRINCICNLNWEFMNDVMTWNMYLPTYLLTEQPWRWLVWAPQACPNNVMCVLVHAYLSRFVGILTTVCIPGFWLFQVRQCWHRWIHQHVPHSYLRQKCELSNACTCSIMWPQLVKPTISYGFFSQLLLK